MFLPPFPSLLCPAYYISLFFDVQSVVSLTLQPWSPVPVFWPVLLLSYF